MVFFEKVKNMFTEEVEDDDVKVEQIKKEVTKVAIESPNVKKEEDGFIDNFEFKSEEKISTPVFFDDNDFKDLSLENSYKEPKVEVKEKEIYGSKIITSNSMRAGRNKFKGKTPVFIQFILVQPNATVSARGW